MSAIGVREHPPPGTRLEGWKAIGRYLGKNPRTAQRWMDWGMPVWHVHGRNSSVYAYADEIERWLRGRAPEGEPRAAPPADTPPPAPPPDPLERTLDRWLQDADPETLRRLCRTFLRSAARAGAVAPDASDAQPGWLTPTAEDFGHRRGLG